MKLFTAPWCANCKPVKKYIEDFMLDVEVIDISKEPAKASEYGVRTLPTLVKDDDSQLVGSAVILQYLKGN